MQSHITALISVCLIGATAVSCSLCAQDSLPTGDWIQHGFTGEQREQIRAAFLQGIEQKMIPGGSLLLIHKGEVIFREGFGAADLETARPFTPETPCRIASLTKPHTATTLVILAEQGKLALDDPVDKYLPEFKGIRVRGSGTATRAPTIAECLSHTAGFPGNNAIKAGRVKLDFNSTLAKVVSELAKQPLLAEPGTRYAYSRLGYMTAAHAAEVVTGKPFPEIMGELLLEPIRADESTFEPSGELRDRMAVLYVRSDDGFQPRTRPPDAGTVLNPGGELVATLDGVGRLMLVHRNHGTAEGKQIVSADSLAKMYVPAPNTPGEGYGLGFNVMLRRPDGTARRIRHTGASGTYAMLDFDQDLIVVILTQVPQTQTGPWRQKLLQAITSAFD